MNIQKKITKNICITVKHDGLDSEINITYDDKKHNILNQFLDKLNNLINDI